MCTGGNANRRGDVPAGVLPGFNSCKIYIFHYLKLEKGEHNILLLTNSYGVRRIPSCKRTKKNTVQ